MPIGALAEAGLLNTSASDNAVAGLRTDAQAAYNFFGPNICAANNNTVGPVVVAGANQTAKWPGLCAACSVCLQFTLHLHLDRQTDQCTLHAPTLAQQP